jgi:hypothetical protein
MPQDAPPQDPRQAAVRHDPASGRFVLEVEGGGEARLSYRESGGVMDFYSTWTTPALRGRGLAAEVVRAGFDYAREHGLEVRPSCPYVDTFLRRYPRYRDLLVGSGSPG